MGHSAKKITYSNKGDDIDVTKLPHWNLACTYLLPTRFQNVADICIYLKNHNIPKLLFIESRHKMINGLLAKGALEFVTISDIPTGMRICNSRYVDKIKNQGKATAFEKPRLVV